MSPKKMYAMAIALALVALYYGRVSYENTTPDAKKVLTKEA